MNNPLISIVTVSYNAASVIEETILSVIHQTYSQIEYIIIDGGSTDNTNEIIKKYLPGISYYKSEPDKGIYDAMNKAIKVAKGEWINFLNCGDSFTSENVIAEVFGTNTFENIGVIYGNVNKKYDNVWRLVKPKSIKNMEHHLPFCHQASFCRREWMKEMFDLKYRFVADDAFFFNLYRKGVQFHYVDITIANYESLYGFSSKNMKMSLWENYKVRGGKRYMYWFVFIYLPIIIKHKLFIVLKT